MEKDKGCCLIPSVGCCVGLFILFLCIIGVPAAMIGAVATGGPDPLYEDFEPSETQASAYEAAFNNAVQSAIDNEGRFILRFTDRQFTSWVSLRTQEVFFEDDVPDRLRDDLQIQARFEDGEIQTYLAFPIVDFWADLRARIRLDFTVTPAEVQTTNDKFDVTVTDFQLGRVSGVGEGQTNLDEGLTEIINERLGPIGGDYTVESVTIDGGTFTMTGVYTGDPSQLQAALGNSSP